MNDDDNRELNALAALAVGVDASDRARTTFTREAPETTDNDGLAAAAALDGYPLP